MRVIYEFLTRRPPRSLSFFLSFFLIFFLVGFRHFFLFVSFLRFFLSAIVFVSLKTQNKKKRNVYCFAALCFLASWFSFVFLLFLFFFCFGFPFDSNQSRSDRDANGTKKKEKERKQFRIQWRRSSDGPRSNSTDR